jgi:hypothetical protein
VRGRTFPSGCEAEGPPSTYARRGAERLPRRLYEQPRDPPLCSGPVRRMI